MRRFATSSALAFALFFFPDSSGLRAADPPSTIGNVESTRLAESALAELLAAVRSGKYRPLDKKHPPSPLDEGELADCSHDDPHELAAKAAGISSGYIFNGVYSWGNVIRKHNARCIYLEEPFNRGLNAIDAADFLMSQRLRMDMPADKLPDLPDLERLLKTALDRFGGDAGSAEEGFQKDLIDCVDFETSALEVDDNVSVPIDKWMLDGMYSGIFHYSPHGTCLVVSSEGDSRGLTAREARAFLRAVRAGIDDPEHAEKQRVQNCFAAQTGASNIPAYESGTINGRRYRVFYAALDKTLKPLDEAQHAWAGERKAIWKQTPPAARRADSAFDIEIRVRSTGSTKRLATLEATEGAPGEQYSASVLFRNWMLHIPSGRMLAFEDLFVDPKAMRERIVSGYLQNAPNALESIMASTAFLGDDSTQQEKDFRASYLSATRRIATAPADHFIRVEIASGGEYTPHFTGAFSLELLPDESPAFWRALRADVSPYFKPEFSNVLDGALCSPISPD